MRRRWPRGALWTATYVACFVLVVSFIFFEVLDVDGSDFQNPFRSATTIKVGEPEADLRRAPLPLPLVVQPVFVMLNRHAEKLQAQDRMNAACADTPAHNSLRRDSRRTLARGSLLPDPSRSA